MARTPRVASALLLIFLTGISAAQGSAHSWKIQSPYPDNPLKQALLSGAANLGKLTTRTDLQLECRPDGDGPRLNLIFDPSEVRLDADPFEGPGGLGERTSLRLTLGKTTWSHHFSGYFIAAKTFVLSFALSSAEARLSTSGTASQPLTISVDPAKPGEPLRFVFELPAGNQAVRSMVAPCLNPRR